MQAKNRLFVVVIVLLCLAFSLSAADKKKDAKADDAAKQRRVPARPMLQSVSEQRVPGHQSQGSRNLASMQRRVMHDLQTWFEANLPAEVRGATA